VLPSVFSVGGIQETVAEPLEAWVSVTEMAKLAARLEVAVVGVIRMPGYVPAFAAPGVP